MSYRMESEHLGWNWDESYYDPDTGEEVYFWEPIPLSFARLAMDPSSSRAMGMIGVQLGIWASMSAFTLWLEGVAYRSLSGLIFEAVTGVAPGPVLLAASPLIGAAGTSFIWNEHIGDIKTGSTHYAQSGMMSGGSMPVVPSGNLWWDNWELPW